MIKDKANCRYQWECSWSHWSLIPELKKETYSVRSIKLTVIQLHLEDFSLQKVICIRSQLIQSLSPNFITVKGSSFICVSSQAQTPSSVICLYRSSYSGYFVWVELWKCGPLNCNFISSSYFNIHHFGFILGSLLQSVCMFYVYTIFLSTHHWYAFGLLQHFSYF